MDPGKYPNSPSESHEDLNGFAFPPHTIEMSHTLYPYVGLQASQIATVRCDEPWGPYNLMCDSTQTVQDVGMMLDGRGSTGGMLEGVVITSSNCSSPRQAAPSIEGFQNTCGIDNALLNLDKSVFVESVRSDKTIESNHSSKNRHRQTTHQLSNYRYSPYRRPMDRSSTLPSYSTCGYLQSDFGRASAGSPTDLETQSNYSNEYLMAPHTYYSAWSRYSCDNDSINPQQLTVSSPHSEQRLRESYSSTFVEPSRSPNCDMASESCMPNIEGYSNHPSGDAALESSLDGESEVGQMRLEAYKKSAQTKKGSKEQKKTSPRTCGNRVQKKCDSKAGKSGKKKCKERHRCLHQNCSNSPEVFNNATELRKHTQVKHIRPFKCTFSFAGCDQVFGSKNEWKRHVSSQHMILCIWECNLSLCKDRMAHFNRKDLFGQHLKRMHVPQGRKIESCWTERQKKDVMEQNQLQREQWVREEIPKIQESCYRVLREPPTESNCELCGFNFSGPKSWDAKMEHVGKHYENGDSPFPGGPFEDEGLIKWALEHGIVERLSDESSSNGSENNYFELTSGRLPKPPMEDKCKYQFTKVNHFLPKGANQNSTQYSGRLTLGPEVLLVDYNKDLYHDEFLLLDGAFEEDPPGDHDTRLLLTGGRVV